ncbi:MAG: UDP-3-O-acyl-N-acetylglucosamine deacetylase [Verrucomicrobia bacterium]|nr:UDP-3-O-acyl-N-acetylglucosamine deacetylase [Verrucomicrobiota bacterium]
MSAPTLGIILDGDAEQLRRSAAAFHATPVDQDTRDWDCAPIGRRRTTLAGEVSVTGPGTFLGRAARTLTFGPSLTDGWWFDRSDLADQLPIRVSTSNVWTTARNIVLRSGSPHNYMRMVEHIIALKLGMNLDNVVIQMESGDPPLFDRGSMDLVEAVERAGIVELDEDVPRFTVREPVTIGDARGGFLTCYPDEAGRGTLQVDCAIDFRTAIGRQRLRTTVTPETFRHGAQARTNTTFARMLFTKTVGKLFADVRNLGYTTRNILIAGRFGYFNEPKLIQDGKSLEAVWHRSMMDLVAALSLMDEGRFVGGVDSYKAGHTLDVLLLKRLHRDGLFVRV